LKYGPQWEDLLDEIDAYLEGHEDILDGSDGEQLPNKAMSLLTSLRYLRPAVQPEAREPVAWIASNGAGKAIHFAKADGWQIDVVQTAPQIDRS
jgi:hypothetical protein